MELRRLIAWASLGLSAIPLNCARPEAVNPEDYEVEVQGHRGARGLLPENTLPAFDLALELGVTTLELDVGLSRDGVVVVAHDPYVSPSLCLKPGGSLIDAKRGPLLRELSLAEIQRYDCGSLNPDAERFPEPPRVNLPGTRIPSLAEVYALAAERHSSVRFNVEIKSWPNDRDTAPLETFVAKVIEVIRNAQAVEGTTLQSFNWHALEAVKRNEPRLRTAGLVAPDTLDHSWLGLDPEHFPDFLSLLKAADYVDELSPYWPQLLPGRDSLGVSVEALQSAGYRVVPWTLNDRESMRSALDLEVDGIITDFPNVLIEEVRRAGGRVSAGAPIPGAVQPRGSAVGVPSPP